MNNDEKERDAAIAIEEAESGCPFSEDELAGFYLGWNASRKHRDLQIADELEQLVKMSVSIFDELGEYIKQLREGTK